MGVLVDRGDDAMTARLGAEAVDLAPDIPLPDNPAAGRELHDGAVAVAIGARLALRADPVLEAGEQAPVQHGEVIGLGKRLGLHGCRAHRGETVGEVAAGEDPADEQPLGWMRRPGGCRAGRRNAAGQQADRRDHGCRNGQGGTLRDHWHEASSLGPERYDGSVLADGTGQQRTAHQRAYERRLNRGPVDCGGPRGLPRWGAAIWAAHQQRLRVNVTGAGPAGSGTAARRRGKLARCDHLPRR